VAASVTSTAMGLGVINTRAASLERALAPRRVSSSERRMVLFAVDSLAIATSLLVPMALGLGGTSPAPNAPLVSFGVLLIIWTISAAVFDCYDPRVAGRPSETFHAASRALIATAVVYFAIQLVVPGLIPPITMNVTSLAVWIAVALVAVSAGRIAYAKLVAGSVGRRRIAFVGTPASWRAAAELLKAIEIEYEVAGLVTHGNRGDAGDSCKLLGPQAELGRIVREHEIDEVIVADAGEDPSTMDELIAPYESGVIVRHLSDVFEEVSGRIPVRYLRPHWFAVLPRRPGGGRAYDLARRSADVVAASIALVLVAPVLAAVALAVRLDSRGPVIFRQEREGYRGRCFTMLKFRTMRSDAEASGPVWASKGDPRRTRVGRLLRPTRLDELPQLWNVLIGDMSIIGPRPERPCFVAELGQSIPFYRARTLVRPGITGWAQVRFAYAGSTEDALEKLQYDLYYVKHRSPFLDLVIALKTVGVLLRACGR
jgi:exopolysaccharide biosynthesis polyprenyl glycosylphosphotransferase